MTKTEYPVWKKVAWEFGRTFVATFLVQLAVFLPLLSDPANVNDWWKVVLLPTLTATIKAFAEWLRKRNEGDYKSLSYKLPI